MTPFFTRLSQTWKRTAGHRREFVNELLLSLDARMERFYTRSVEYESFPLAEVLHQLEEITRIPLKLYLQEDGLHEIDEAVMRHSQRLGHEESGATETYARHEFAQLYYVLCRAFQPEIILETGVAYGRSSAYILKALSINGKGILYSIDRPLPTPGSETLIGTVVPDELKRNWQLHLGTAYSLFPKLLPQLGGVDIFIHDSRHTYRNMKYKFGAVFPYLNRPGFVLSDDADQNPAFHKWASQSKPRYWTTMAEEGKRLLGVSFFDTK